ncbi:MAG: Nramp family divalent metal transporter [Acidobacteriota bacterium]
MGPGIITSMVGNDASGVAAYSVAGAEKGYSILWILFFSGFSLAVTQEMAARLGIVSGKGLSDLIRENFGIRIALFAMTVHVITCLATSISEFAGIAASLQLFGVSRYASIPVALILIWLLIVKGNYKIAEKVFLFLSLFYFSYIISVWFIKPDWGNVLKSTFIPQFEFNFEYTYLLIALVGTTVTPWMQYYLQSSVVDKGIKVAHYKYEKAEVYLGSFSTCFFAFFIMVASASTLFKEGIHVETAEQAAMALKPLAGQYCFILFGLGFLNASLLGATILPLASSYAACEFFGWESGLGKKLKDAPQFYMIFTASILVSGLIILIPDFPLIRVMIFSQSVNGILLPVILILMLKLINNKRIMGNHVNNKTQNLICGGLALFLISITVILLFLTFVK